MGTCLKTQLKAAVDNANLPSLFELKIKVTNPAILLANPTYINVVLSSGSISIAEDGSYISIPDYRNIVEINDYRGVGLKVNFSSLSLSTSLTKININYPVGSSGSSVVTGSVTDLPDSIRIFFCRNSEINIKDLGHLININEITLNNVNPWNNLSGSLEEFVAAQKAAGRTANPDGLYIGNRYGTPISVNGSNVTYQGVVLTGNPKIVSWTAGQSGFTVTERS